MNLHLHPDALVDLAESADGGASCEHLRACAACRRQVDELRATMALTASVDVPEPSPLFWDHLSARVREAVAVEEPARPASWGVWLPRLEGDVLVRIGLVTAAAALALVVTLPRVTRTPGPARLAPAVASEMPALQPFGEPDDPALALVGELSADSEPDAVLDPGWSSHVGSVDEAVGNLTNGERRELQRLLTEMMGKPGA